MSDLCLRPATELVELLRTKELSAVELLAAHMERIDRINPQVNAIVTFTPELAQERAKAADAATARGESLGPLHGLPVAHKDTTATKGIRTTWGSPIYKDFVPETNALIIERMQAAGCVTIGKTNVPEFGAGSQTFNTLFGKTRNPYDLTKTSGGSSGGAAVALATGMHAIADGSDLGGSLRNPGHFNNVVGFRPSPGRIPSWPSEMGWYTMTVTGPLGRTVGDVAMMMSAVAGDDPRAPHSITQPGSIFAGSLARSFKGARIAFSPTLGGLPVDPDVSAVLADQRRVFTELGCTVVDAEPDVTGADEAFHAYRAWSFEGGHVDDYANHRDKLKDTVIWNIEEGKALTGPDLARAEMARTRVFQSFRRFFEQHDFLVLPVNQVPAFSNDIPYPTEINGVQMQTYIEWMRSCSRVTVSESPAISVPAGFTPGGLPVGIQIVGRYRDDLGVLQIAHAFEQATQVWKQHPAIAL